MGTTAPNRLFRKTEKTERTGQPVWSSPKARALKNPETIILTVKAGKTFIKIEVKLSKTLSYGFCRAFDTLCNPAFSGERGGCKIGCNFYSYWYLLYFFSFFCTILSFVKFRNLWYKNLTLRLILLVCL